MSSRPPESPAASVETDRLSEAGLNRFQRAYFRWAEPYYQKLDEPYRSEGRRMDRYLYSRRGLRFWAAVLVLVAGSAWGLHQMGFPVLLATLCSVLVWASALLAAGSAWLMPDSVTTTRLWRRAGWIGSSAFVAAMAGFLVGRALHPQGFGSATAWASLLDAGRLALPVLLVVVAAISLLSWTVARWRRLAIQRELVRLRESQDRDLLARQTAEARLALLQAQIQPHFIFNTLAALQHWVDQGDPRAGPLLRVLTQFLRGSTELLGRPRVPLADEVTRVVQYLDILRARLGDRLVFSVEIPADVEAVPLPPGLLLTLVENAVEHGIAPALSGGAIHVAAQRLGQRLHVQVMDSGVGLAPGWQAGTGLTNSQERLRHFADGSATLRLFDRPEGGTLAALDLPLESS